MSVSLQPDARSFSEAVVPTPARQGGVLSPFGWMYADAGQPEGLPRESRSQQPVAAEASAPPVEAPAVTAESVDPQPAAGNMLFLPVESSPETLLNAMSLLQAGLLEANIDPSAVNLRASENLEWSPFGSYYDRQIEVRLPDGQWFKLSADLTARSPHVAVWDIQRALGLSF